MSVSLIPLFPGRPAIIQKDGQYVYVSVRDGLFLRKRQQWKRMLIDNHPDSRKPMSAAEWHKIHSRNISSRFNSILYQYRKWLVSEYEWYRSLGLYPPGGVTLHQEQVQKIEKKLAPRVRKTCTRHETTCPRIRMNHRTADRLGVACNCSHSKQQVEQALQ